MDHQRGSSGMNWSWQHVAIAMLSLASLSMAVSYYSARSSANLSRRRIDSSSSIGKSTRKVSRRNPRRRDRPSVSYEEGPRRTHQRESTTSASIISTETAFRAIETVDSQDKSSDESKNLVNLLYSIAEDQARKDGFVHRSITCNHCGTSPIRGFRYKCANCLDYDLCESCEAQEVHPKVHVFIKIRIPIPPLANPRTALLTPFYPGKEGVPPSLTWEELRSLQKETHFDQVELEAFYEQFKSLSTTSDGGVTKETFDTCLGPLGVEKNLVTERIFSFFDQNNDGIISFSELVCGLSILCKGSLDERIKHAFCGYDLDGDGFISRSELHRMFKAYFHLSMELVRDVVKTMEEGMMESFDDEAAKPVSAAFAAPIPSSSATNHDDVEELSKPKVESTSQSHPSSTSADFNQHNHTASSNIFSNNHSVGHTNSASTSQLYHGSIVNNSTSSTNTISTDINGAGHTGSHSEFLTPFALSETSSLNSAQQPSLSQSQLPKKRAPMLTVTSVNASTSNNLAERPALSSPILTSDAERLRNISSSPQPLEIPNNRRRNVLVSGLITEHLPQPIDPSLYTPSTNTRLYTPGPQSAYRSPEPDRFFHFSNGGASSSSAVHYSHTISQHHNGSASEHWPVMEAMSQDAIEEMVERTFSAAGLVSEDKMNFDHFRKVVEADPNLLSWFEALGSVF